MLIQGGISKNGFSNTLSVSGLYSSSWKNSFSKTTAPSVVATFWPTVNRLSSVMDTWPWRTSCSRFCMPLAMLSPLVSMAFFWASALNARKLLGAAAARPCSTAKRKRLRVLASDSTASVMASKARLLSKYSAAVKAATGLASQASLENRLSPDAEGCAKAPCDNNSAASLRYCCCTSCNFSGVKFSLGGVGSGPAAPAAGARF